jgi:hypothetical protein
MSLSDLASLGSFVSGIAVLTSLIYVGYQVRQASRHQRAQLLQTRTARTLDFQMRSLEPWYRPIREKLLGRDGDLTLEEFREVRAAAFVSFLSEEESFLQYKDGLLSEAAFELVKNNIRRVFGFPRPRVIWRQGRRLFDPGFCCVMDELLNETQLVDTPRVLSDFNSAVNAEIIAVPTRPGVS